MNIDGKHYRTIWLNSDGSTVEIIDQTKLPFVFETVTLKTLDDAARAISTMQVRGAPLIGATAAFGVCLALLALNTDECAEQNGGGEIDRDCQQLSMVHLRRRACWRAPGTAWRGRRGWPA